jgi:adenylate cyclase
MTFRHEMLSRLRAFLFSANVAISVATLALLALVSASDPWRRLELKGFDLLTVASAPGRSALPITIVGIDEASFAQIGQQWPWPRRMHAELLEQLNRAGALVVAFDLVLAEKSNDEDDRLLAQAIGKAGNVIMAADMAYQESQYARQWLRVEPLNEFKAAGAASGLANVSLDGDLVVRSMPEGGDVFWREIIRRANQRQPGLLEEPPALDRRLIRYVGPDHTFPYVSYYQALHADSELPSEIFKDQIVLVGRDVKASPEAGAAQADLFATPFAGWTGWLTPGAEIHANILESAISRAGIAKLSFAWSFALLALVTMLSAALMRHWRPIRSAAAGLLLILVIAATDWGLFAHWGFWLPALAAMLGVVAVYAGFGGYAFLTEQRQRRETRRAFSMYLAPEVVEQIMAHPEKLALGGERRDITLLFTDLAGFTQLSEQLDAEHVAQLLNLHFSQMTAIIKRHGGTVNRFIGDAIMAFWGAPLADNNHALNACLAARDMQLQMKKQRDDLVKQGLPALWMRVGIHSGTAVVGNLGSADRFDYTAIGDAVNLASRLEGVNKLYGTEILLSAETAQRIGQALELRQVDRVIVKGKSAAVDVFTIGSSAEVNALTLQALTIYMKRRWDESETLWRRLMEIDPQDRVAALYLERIAAFRLAPPAADWDGATALDKL